MTDDTYVLAIYTRNDGQREKEQHDESITLHIYHELIFLYGQSIVENPEAAKVWNLYSRWP